MFSNDLICFGIVHVLVAYQRNMCVAGPEPSPENILCPCPCDCYYEKKNIGKSS
jgi:hypothetical protein